MYGSECKNCIVDLCVCACVRACVCVCVHMCVCVRITICRFTKLNMRCCYVIITHANTIKNPSTHGHNQINCQHTVDGEYIVISNRLFLK